uniref:DUF881 domain-containing protein n=1 Tax=candidate division CPR3 bacterium TaxID=2268181 RepID=A0A7C4R3L6_UNCC3
MKLAYEITESANNIFSLQDEFFRLNLKKDSFSFDMKDKEKMKNDIESKINNYRVVNGLDQISGRGIEIKVEGIMVTEEIVDLINGIRNTKPDAIAINNKRIIYRSYFVVDSNGQIDSDGNKSSFPIYIQVVGDPDSLTKSLDRSGGILDILKNNSFEKLKFSVERKDNLVLPPHGGKIDFRYSKAVNY